MAKKYMISELPFKFQNVGTISSCGASVKAAPALVIDKLFCMMNSVKIKVNFVREEDRMVALSRRQDAREQERRLDIERKDVLEKVKERLGVGPQSLTGDYKNVLSGGQIQQILDESGLFSIDAVYGDVLGGTFRGRLAEDPIRRMLGKTPMHDGVGDNILWIPYGVKRDENFLLKQCFSDDMRATLKLWEVIVWSNRLQFSFCDANDPGRDKHSTRASVELEGRITLRAELHAESFASEPERQLFVRYGEDAAEGWGNYVDVTTGTEKDGIAQARFYPKGSMDQFAKIAASV